jgi:DNA mismatch repair protein MutS2
MSSNQLYHTLEFHKVLDDVARRTHCPVTAERIRQLQPFSDALLVQGSLDRISELRGIMDSGEAFPMDAFEDIRNHLRFAVVEGSYLEPKAFGQIHRVLTLSARLQRFAAERRSALSRLFGVAGRLALKPDLVKAIIKIINLQSLEVQDQASPTLGTIRREMERTREQVRRHLEKLLDTLSARGVLQERLITIRSGRMVLPVKETHRHLVKGVLHDKSASGATAYMEPLETLELNNRIRRLEAEERHEIEKVLRVLTGLVREELPDLEEGFECLITLDSVHAMALASRAMGQQAPAISSQGVLRIKNGRHPLLALKTVASSSPVTPLNLSVGETFKTLVITGPNAGGKTVALKTVGLLALMTACGLHIPADADSQIPVSNRIFALVGDAQSIEMNLSTFSAHLAEIKAIVEESSRGDLVLIDEIGTGTDPQEGSALAMAVLETLTARGVLTIVTTHHGALKAFAHKTPGVANGSMAFDSETLNPTYEFRAGIPGSSYALEIARRLGIPEGIVGRSRELMGTQAHRMEELILELEHQIERNEALKKALESEQTIVGDLKEQFESKSRRLKEKADALHREAVSEADAIVKRANAAVEKAIRTIREKGATTESIREAKALIQEERQTVKGYLPVDEPDLVETGEVIGKESFAPGSHVRWKRGDKRGTVLEQEDQAGRLLVGFDSLKVRVPKTELQPSEHGGQANQAGRFRVNVQAPSHVSMEIDIRGMRVEEALTAVDKFLSDAVLAGLVEVHIIHGMGTGALRNSIVPFLNAHPLVVGTQTGGGERVNPGVTVARMVQ